jgi:hypothetical protein
MFSTYLGKGARRGAGTETAFSVDGAEGFGYAGRFGFDGRKDFDVVVFCADGVVLGGLCA